MGIVIACAQAAPARAQDDIPFDPAIDLQLFDYAIGPKTFFSVTDADVSGKGQFSVDFLVTFLTDPFVVWNVAQEQDEIVNERTTVVDSLLAGQIVGAYGLTDRFQLGASLPLVFTANGDGIDPSTGMAAPSSFQSTGLGDLRTEFKARLWKNKAMRLAGAGALTLPTSVGSDNDFIGDNTPSLRSYVSFQWTGVGGKLSTGVNAGFVFRKKRTIYASEVGQQITYGVAGAYQFTDRFSGVAELFGRTGLTTGLDVDSSPLEIGGGARVHATKTIAVVAGLGAGLVRGIGSPTLRAFVSVGWAPDYRDDDDDGVINVEDLCPLVPEDSDGYDDRDGCPDEDNDGDKRDDSSDKCPNEAEDLDGFEDFDGCPEPDNDEDGFLDGDDRCPTDAEDGGAPYPKDGCPANKRDSDLDTVMDADDQCPEREEDLDEFEDWDGCPDADNDGDGIADEDDTCPLCAEDSDGFQDGDGCPDADNDGDGFVDTADSCPLEAETVNGVDDGDGCPDTGGREAVELDGDRLVFAVAPDFRRDRIRRQSESILDQAATVMRAHPEVVTWMVVITSRRFAQERGDAIKQRLVDQGVPAGRIEVLASQSADTRVGIVIRERTDADLTSPEFVCPASLQVQPRAKPAPTDASAPAEDTGDAGADAGDTAEPTFDDADADADADDGGDAAAANDAGGGAEALTEVPEAFNGFAGVSNRISFRRNQARFRPGAAKALNAIAALMKEHPSVHIEIGCHTDSRKGPDKSREITQKQCDAARDQLVKQGLAEERITATGHGMDQPIGNNHVSKGREANRRVEISFSIAN